MDRKKDKAILWILPAMICMSVIQFLPGILSIVIGFTNLDVKYIRKPFESDFIGFENFSSIFQSGTAIGNSFLDSLLVTLLFTFLSCVLGYLLGLGAALLLNKEFKFRAVFRALLIIPWMVPSVVSAFIWRLIFLKDYGILNKILVGLGVIDEGVFWLLGKNAFITIVVARVWSSFPFIMISLLAALQTIPHDQYEAAKIDGAGTWQQFWYITLPGIAPVSKVLALLQVIWGMGEFTIPYIMFAQAPPVEANLLSVMIYQNAFRTWDFGGGAAISTVTLVIMLIFAMIYMRMVLNQEEN